MVSPIALGATDLRVVAETGWTPFSDAAFFDAVDLAGTIGAKFAVPEAGAVTGIFPAITIENTVGVAQATVDKLRALVIFAFDTWGSVLAGQATPNVTVSIVSSTPSGRFQGGPGNLVYVGSTTRDSVVYNIYEPPTAYELRTGKEAPAGSVDIRLTVQASYLDTLFLDPTPSDAGDLPTNMVDGLSVLLHEIAHAIGFSGYYNEAANSFDFSANTPYDARTILRANEVYFDGPNVRKVYGDAIALTNNNYTHYGNSSAYPGTSSDPLTGLMNGVVYYLGYRYSIAAIDLAVMADLGIGTTADDIFDSAAMRDFNGGAGNDTVTYDRGAFAGGVTVSLAITGAQTIAPSLTATLVSIENLAGSSAGDTFVGNGFANILTGNGGDDLLEGSGGNDTLLGGPGTDTAVFSGNSTSYSVTSAVDGSITVTDTRAGAPDGSDTLWTIEKLKFANGTFDAASPAAVQPVADQSSPEDSPWSFVVPAGTFSDMHGDPLSFDAKIAGGAALPSWLAFDVATRMFSGTPPANFFGSLDILLTTTGGSATASDTFRLTITPVNDAPVVAPATQALSATTGQARSFTVIASDVDGDALSWTAGAAQHGTVAGGSGGTFTYTSSAGFTGADSFTVVVSDGHGGSASQTINMTVSRAGSASYGTGVFLGAADHVELASGQLKVFGSSGPDVVGLTTEVRDVAMDQNVDTIVLPHLASAYTFLQQGNQLVVQELGELVLIVPVQRDADGTVLVFSNGTASATAQGAAMWVGGAVVPADVSAYLSPSLGPVLPVPVGASKAQAFLGADERFIAASDGIRVYGAAGQETLAIDPGAVGVIADQAVDRIDFAGAFMQYAFHQSGNRITVWDQSDTQLLLTIPVQGDANGTGFSFSAHDYTASLVAGSIQFTPVFG
jgi:hypothetical protein